MSGLPLHLTDYYTAAAAAAAAAANDDDVDDDDAQMMPNVRHSVLYTDAQCLIFVIFTVILAGG